jgi:hypothetical protein
MVSSVYKNKETIKEIYKNLEVISSNSNSLKKPNFNKILNDIEVFDNNTYIIRTLKYWFELKPKTL